tara:strand:+ start:192 stop:353 length:162 start_codon:yes stop_codon:yes gene_type:complete
MPKALYKKEIKELKALKKDGRKIAQVGQSIVNKRIFVLNKKLKKASKKTKFRK